MSAYCVVFVIEGDLDDAMSFESKIEADAYRAGFEAGASEYGGDGASAYVLPGSEEEILEEHGEKVHAGAIGLAVSHGVSFAPTGESPT